MNDIKNIRNVLLKYEPKELNARNLATQMAYTQGFIDGVIVKNKRLKKVIRLIREEDEH